MKNVLSYPSVMLNIEYFRPFKGFGQTGRDYELRNWIKISRHRKIDYSTRKIFNVCSTVENALFESNGRRKEVHKNTKSFNLFFTTIIFTSFYFKGHFLLNALNFPCMWNFLKMLTFIYYFNFDIYYWFF